MIIIFQNNNNNGYNQGQVQQQHEQYHSEHGRLPITNGTVGASTISSDSYHQNPARAAPSQGYVGDLHQLEFIPNGYGSAWSTGGGCGGNPYNPWHEAKPLEHIFEMYEMHNKNNNSNDNISNDSVNW